MENNVKIMIATFYAFGQKSQRAFVDKTEEEINEDLKYMCNTNHLLTLEYFSATLIDKKIINEETVIEPEAKGAEED